MGIEIKCFATLARFLPDNAADYPAASGETIRSLLAKLDIPEDEVALLFINSARAYLDSKLKDGDRVGIFPAVGGG
ncbi:MAG: MoaD/ThiS family protein [Pseudodesulfovibrio sp.]|uniref:ThiamineS protein n=1 Tax=Pseudodesulfovibrio aespoeensis (strain ATCC 700646 / DSM 10631 / Aspo-2) TaxID=643562 RepID=E6VV96_PSEA9|nr:MULTISPECIES: MoaD/ThiS family protein [Pseudodesulfovibrio]MBU4191879.1 MoaD/ThiS family protein [Pseudomonadota bacterium]ADU62340.1 thiamineS protein [Pseudodesulfovibrio aespoeensis Aspo-2]MBU4243742.1 MoaD/ThiS family protein [Pseudomonadota bacterium]MBU4377675.1 MoaD/ThiS family protein [Pseudomonadota bacterium]MBU4473995.1 MoaD/ThiS family protein [Pseudomonadota bacterium]